MVFTDGWQSSNDIRELIDHRYDQIWEITIVLKLSYDCSQTGTQVHEQFQPL